MDTQRYTQSPQASKYVAHIQTHRDPHVQPTSGTRKGVLPLAHADTATGEPRHGHTPPTDK